MIWSLVQVTVIFFSHLLTLPLMDESKPEIRHPGLVWIGSFSVLEFISLVVLLIVGDFNLISGSILLVLSSLLYGTVFVKISAGPVMKDIFLFTSYCTYYMFAADLALLISMELSPRYSTLAGLIIIALTVISYSLLLKYKIALLIKKSTAGIQKGWKGMMAFALVTFIAVSFTILLSLFHAMSFFASLLVFISMFTLVTTAFAVVLMMIRLLNERNEMYLLRSQQRLMRSELEAEEEFIDNARRYRHDMKHHSRLILQYAEEGDLDGIKAYLKEFDIELEDSSMNVWCANKVVNAMMRITARRCAVASIELNVKMNFPDELPLSGPELGTVFGNLLDNAIEAASKSSNPFISVFARTGRKMVYVEIRNSMTGRFGFDGVFPRSSKPHGGIGLRSVSTILERYGGMLNCSQDENIFITQFVIPL